MINNDVFIIEEDFKGRIWFGTYTNELCYFYNDTIIPYKHNEELKKYLKGNSVKTSLHVTKDETVYLGDAIYNLIKIDSSGNSEMLGHQKRNVFDFEDFVLTSSQKVIKKDERPIQGYNQISFFKGEVFKESFQEQLAIDENLIDATGNHYLIHYGDDSLVLVHGNFLLTKFKGETSYRLMKYRADDIYMDRKKRIWTGSIYTGAYAYSDPYLENEEFHVLSGNSITHVIEDFQGGFWFTTLDNGVFHYPSMNKGIRNRQLPNDKVRQVFKRSGRKSLHFIR